MDVRLFKTEEKRLLQETIHGLWAANHILSRDEELLDYMFHSAPLHHEIYGADHYGFLGAWHNHEIIGIFGVMPFEVNVFGKKHMGLTPTNWIVPEQHRQTGAGLYLMRELFRPKPDLVLNLGINPTVAKMYSNMGGYSVLPDVPRWIGVVNKATIEKDLLQGNRSFLRYYSPIQAVNGFGSYDLTEQFDAQNWDRFYYEVIAPKTLGFSRNAAFIQWRYMRHPRFKYQIRICRDAHGNDRGMIVYRIESIVNGNYRIARIVDCIYSDQDSAVCLANHLVEMATRENCLFIDYYGFSSVFSWGLEQIGMKRVFKNENDQVVLPTRFQPIDLKVTSMMAAMYTGKNIQRQINAIHDAYIHITKADADQDRPN